jgi:8-oxo-dGTP pyrophosphatase MutT (NUDIX family)
MITKNSYGIILINDNKVLIVQRRYTYAFVDFVMGKYINLENVCRLLHEMTMTELTDVYTLDFSKMWDKLWLPYNTVYRHNTFLYEKVFNKFKTYFLYDKGNKLKSFVEQTIPAGSLVWNIPRGRKNSPREADVHCAIRELEEETGYKKSSYTILPNYTKEISYVNNDIKYICKYYVAMLNDHTIDRLFDVKNSREISDQKWASMVELQFVNKKDFLVPIVRVAMKLVKKYKKGSFLYLHP